MIAVIADIHAAYISRWSTRAFISLWITVPADPPKPSVSRSDHREPLSLSPVAVQSAARLLNRVCRYCPPLLSPPSRSVTTCRTRLSLATTAILFTVSRYYPPSWQLQNACRYLSYLTTLDPRPDRIASRVCHYSPSAAASVPAADTRANLARTLERTSESTSRLIARALSIIIEQ